jgi:hypothetical protein
MRLVVETCSFLVRQRLIMSFGELEMFSMTRRVEVALFRHTGMLPAVGLEQRQHTT